ncbi:MAG: tRNA dihydrouridine synthase DusB [Akkermansiaceae bacterium]|nr:tRNA dihydrouridine synthase DusB [Akkermansiaceae bacterium]
MALPWFEHKFPLFLAPMAGVTDPIFRTLCKEAGADVMETEFVSAEGVLQAWHRNKKYVEFKQEHRPLGIQIFGSVPEHAAAAARIITDAMQPDFLDINAGCPVPKVVGKNGGSSLLKDLPLLQRIAAAVVNELGQDCPVTAKIRIGWDAEHICAPEACQRLQDAGVQSITIHGRTRSQQYSGQADWQMIDLCAGQCCIPIVGNGDIASPQDVKQARESTAVSGVMIGRAAMNAPWLFARAKKYLESGEIAPEPTPEERIHFMLRHTRMALDSGHYGTEIATMRAMRARLLAYAKGIPGTKAIRPQLSRVGSYAELEDMLLNRFH